jgi:hypothetical protein
MYGEEIYLEEKNKFLYFQAPRKLHGFRKTNRQNFSLNKGLAYGHVCGI